MNKLAKNLKKARVKNKLSIGQFSKHLGIERSLYFRYENGSVSPSYPNLKKICVAMGWDMNELS